MTGYSQRTVPVVPPESTEAVILDVAPVADDLNFDLMLSSAMKYVDSAMSTLDECYRLKARKGLDDSRIHLAMVRNLLKSVK